MKCYKRSGLTWAELGMVGLILLLGATAIPAWLHVRNQRWAKECQGNLTKIDGAKEQWALENNKKLGCSVGWTDLVAPGGGTSYLKAKLRCPSGHEYVINAVGSDPACEARLEGHSRSLVGVSIAVD